MRKMFGWLSLAFFLCFVVACKSNFEKTRTSGDGALILKSAFEYYEKGQYQKAQTLFELVLSSIKGGPEAEKATYQYAYTLSLIHI